MVRRVLHGIIRGKTIELLDDVDLADGQKVEVELSRVYPTSDTIGECFNRTEGALKEDPEWDSIMQEVEGSRKHERRSQWIEE
jgi:hypothetical protein